MRKILFIAATHGNERAAVSVMERLEGALPKEEYGYDWIIGNPLAYEQNKRFIEKDLNRSAPGAHDSAFYEERRAAEIIALSAEYDVVIDVHGTSTDCGVVTITPFPTAQNLRYAKDAGLEHNVIWFSEKSVASGPLVQHTHCPGFEIECGPKTDSHATERLKTDIEKIIRANKDGTGVLHPNGEQEFFTVYGPCIGENVPSLRDFTETTLEGETFYPFLSGNEYKGTICYKMKKVAFEEIELKG